MEYDVWTNSIAVGRKKFMEDIFEKLYLKKSKREISSEQDSYSIREESVIYGVVPLNTLKWNNPECSQNDDFIVKKVV